MAGGGVGGGENASMELHFVFEKEDFNGSCDVNEGSWVEVDSYQAERVSHTQVREQCGHVMTENLHVSK